jgi:protein-S-isoprenylcysteine O-methyltransferase Ste14
MTKFDRLFVWAGGAMFALSLAVCAYFFLVVWAAPAAGGGWLAVAINAGIFSIFALHHSVFAREPIKRRLAAVVPERLIRSFYVWTASVLLLAVLAAWQVLEGAVYHVTGWPAVCLAALQLAGLWLIIRSVARIDPLELAGIDAHDRAGNALQTDGPYRWVRHPLYLGWVLVVFGAAHMTANRFAFALMSTMYLMLAIPWEERSLLRAFGDAYAQYQRAVRWRILPFVY